jgi:hypothetical protein
MDHTRGASAAFNSRVVMHGKARELAPGTRHARHGARLGWARSVNDSHWTCCRLEDGLFY